MPLLRAAQETSAAGRKIFVRVLSEDFACANLNVAC
jgi:hypothetical protein